MTDQAASTATEEDGPAITFLITGSLSPDGKNTPVPWAVGDANPLISSMKIMAMFFTDGGIDVYSASQDGKGIRNFIPTHWIRMTQETMPYPVFLDELKSALEGDDDDEEELEQEEDPVNPFSSPQINGVSAIKS